MERKDGGSELKPVMEGIRLVLEEIREIKADMAEDRRRSDADRKRADEDRKRADEDRKHADERFERTMRRMEQRDRVLAAIGQRLLRNQAHQTTFLEEIARSLRVRGNGRPGNGRRR